MMVCFDRLSKLLSGKYTMSLRDILEKAAKSYDLAEQYPLFLNTTRN